MNPENDYARIQAAIEFIDAQAAAQPGLDEIAAHIGLSPFHLQRLFRRWAGTSPKRFLQYLTVSHAKRLLRDRQSILDTALQVGLSSPGRLHDHFVALEAVSPGEYRKRGAGVSIAYGVHGSPFGDMLLAVTERGICWLAFVAGVSAEAELERMRSRWCQADITADNAATAPYAARVFERYRDAGRPLGLDVQGTNFQISVWKALLSIPAGRVASYQAIADYLGRPAASRSVASAIAQNPVGLLIPCHRVIRGTGELAGFRWGTPLKRLMLAREASQHAGEQAVPVVPKQSCDGDAGSA